MFAEQTTTMIFPRESREILLWIGKPALFCQFQPVWQFFRISCPDLFAYGNTTIGGFHPEMKRSPFKLVVSGLHTWFST
jgi:hypothetical protein